jgi:DNA-binding NarL/FixJ family response regulator
MPGQSKVRSSVAAEKVAPVLLVFLAEKLTQIRQPHNARRGKGQLADLTSREREVLGLMCQGQGDEVAVQKDNLLRRVNTNRQ